MEVMKQAAERDRATGDVLHLEVGQPSTAAPVSVRAEAARLLETDRLGYTHALGIDPLRERIARFYDERYGVSVDPARVAITAGASGGMVLSLLARFDVGERIGITEPGYAAYRNIIRALGHELIGVRVDAETRWVPTPDRLDAAGPIEGLVVASPSNPTGTALTGSEFEAVIDWCAANGVTLLSDEIYHGIEHVDHVTTALAHTDDAIVLQSFSKYWSMTGWRIGWLVLPEDLVPPVERLAQNLYVSPPALAQASCLVAFDTCAELDANVARYARSRAILLEAFARWRLPHAPPDGAFYFWVDVSSLGTGEQVSQRWLDEVGVAVTPGIDFDSEGRDFIRVSYSESPDDVAEAVRRLDGLLGG